MSDAAEGKAGKAAVPEVPGVLRLGWMLFMQPIKLRRMSVAWGLEGESLLFTRVWRPQDPVVKALMRRVAVLVFLGASWPSLVLSIVVAAQGAHERWQALVLSQVITVAIASLGGLGAALDDDMTTSVKTSIVLGATASGMAAPNFSLGILGDIIYLTATGMAVGIALGAQGHNSFAYLRLPVYLVEAVWCVGSLAAVRAYPERASRIARWLPFRIDHTIRFPLPGLRSFLITLADRNPALAIDIISEALDTLAQKAPALRALAELRARSLERAARDRTWARAAAFDLPFLPRPDDPSDGDSPLHRCRAVAQDLVAAHLTTDHLRRRNALNRARDTLASFREHLAALSRPDYLERRLLPTTRLWLDVIDDELQALATLESEHPQIPTPFEPGPPLRPEDAHLFKGRVDLIRLIDHDLADHRRAPLLLTGQRRMGKTSLLHMLPGRLGTGTLVLPLNFQALSGNPHKANPHLWLAESLARARPDLPSPPTTADWADTLAWLEAIEPALGKDRVLVAVDEIERLQTGIEEGWATPAFLDFLRAAGDSLRKIRLLIVSAHPLHRLGRAWTDRLISVVHRELGYLEPHEAEELCIHPMDGFPDIYPPGGVARIAGETRGHPYLVQLVCDALVRDLNGRGKLAAEDADITRAVDRAIGDTPLFRELWSDRNDGEREILRELAREGGPLGAREAEARDLLHEGLIEKDGERYRVAVPLFAAWIRERA